MSRPGVPVEEVLRDKGVGTPVTHAVGVGLLPHLDPPTSVMTTTCLSAGASSPASKAKVVVEVRAPKNDKSKIFTVFK